MTTEHKNIHAAYVSAFAAIGVALKDAHNPHFKKNYADLNSVVDAIKPALSDNGLAFIQTPRPNADGAEIATTLIHASGETLDLGSTFVPANKKDAQGFGSAMTYARRYGLQTAFGVPAEDDDGNAASAPQQSAPRQQRNDSLPAKQQEGRMPQNALNDLMAALGAARHNEDYIIQKYRVKNVRDLSQEQYADAMQALSVRAAELAKEGME